MHELLPRAATVGFLENPNNPIHELTTRDVLAAAPVIGLKVQIFEARTDRELDAAFAGLLPGAGDVLGQPQPKLEMPDFGRNQVASEARGTVAKPAVTAPL